MTLNNLPKDLVSLDDIYISSWTRVNESPPE